MKGTKPYYLLLLTVFLISGACENILEENPKDQIFKDNFFQTESDAIGAINSIYAHMNSTSVGPTFGGLYHSTYWVIQGLASDEMNNRLAGAPQNDELEQFRFDAANGNFFDVWSQAYRVIHNANFALEGIATMDLNDPVKNSLLGEARFLRAMVYFDLVRMFGPVPLLLEGDAELRPAKNSVDEIYAQIIDDLQMAANNLPASYSVGDGLGRATSGAARGLLAKVYLTKGDWQLAADNAALVINSGTYRLWPDFADMFKIDNENGAETLFGVGFGDAGGAISFWEVGQFNVRLLPRELRTVAPGANVQGWQVATEDLYNAFDPNDRRRAVTFINSVGGDQLDDPHIRKYWDEEREPTPGNTEADFPYLRYADILLIYAEALNELNGGPNADAYAAINAIRQRARFDGTTEQPVLPDLSNLSQQEFRDAVLLERRREFVAEGHRWFDLVRMGKLQELVPLAKDGVTPRPTDILFPLPQIEIDLNQNLLPQNPGY
ncbi:MAG: RagB/SusD family nutrient uptake outer membrane protein [Cyclobacteriaceae bacterium]